MKYKQLGNKYFKGTIMRYSDDEKIALGYSEMLTEVSTFKQFFTNDKPIEFIHKNLRLKHDTPVVLHQVGGNKLNLLSDLKSGVPLFWVDGDTRTYAKRQGNSEGDTFDIRIFDPEKLVDTNMSYTNPHKVMRDFMKRNSRIYRIQPSSIRPMVMSSSVPNRISLNKFKELVVQKYGEVFKKRYTEILDKIRDFVKEKLDDESFSDEKLQELIRDFRKYKKSTATPVIEDSEIRNFPSILPREYPKLKVNPFKYVGYDNVDFIDDKEETVRKALQLFATWYYRKIATKYGLDKMVDEITNLI